ncbi:hypothetical protein [Planomonospora venezuelensis]|uniref:Small-conductance mechanosensitive channel n=1 Tax=Planomonospora venezuelensis TaxID=1999 RepID=A0A841DDE0_PLAVE|nr:hypothetical protein [Planomonospora venezuelensis]MBB5968100.1 small-conductance mechanosensitive channel [Planomonospora venezuelensis]GIN04351.1 hypothetical protein Pve01_60090 [Planomonospora venezuelensis]
MGRTPRVIIAAAVGLLAAGAVVSAALGGLNWPFALLLVSAGIVGIVDLLKARPSAGGGDS